MATISSSWLALLALLTVVHVTLCGATLEYVQLGAQTGVSEEFLPNLNDVNSNPISIPTGFAIGTYRATTAYVNSNGYIIFDNNFNTWVPVAFPANGQSNFIAPFWVDIDTTLATGGRVSYEIHTNVTSPDLLSEVGEAIRQQSGNENFAGIWMLVAEWHNVPGTFISTALRNTFQAVVITNGFSSYAVFIYKCADLSWNAGGSAVIGFQADNDYYANHPFSRTVGSTDIACSNTNSTFTNIVYQLNLDNFRSFIDLGQTMGLSQVILPSELNAASSMIPIPGGFPFGTSLQSSVYVVEHGYFSFGSLLIQSSPDIFPSSASFLVAPFWAAHDTRGSGQVSYEVHDTSSEVMSRISAYVRQEMNTEFFGVWMLLTYWNGVPAFPHTDNSGVTNTYQAALIMDGDTQSYIVSIYNCASMQWAGGATIGFNTDGKFYKNHPLSGTGSANRVSCSNINSTEWTTLVYQLSGDFLPYLELDNPEPDLPSDDEGVSNPISITENFPLGITTQSTVYVTSNGYFIFGSLVRICCPVPFPPSTSSINHIVSPFWSDIDTSTTGRIFYQIYPTLTESVSQVNNLISRHYGIDYAGRWMLVATWEDVPEFLREEGPTNTFQGVLITDGSHSFAVFTYKCGSLSWSGDATIGFTSGDLFAYHPLSGSNAVQAACLTYPGSAWTNIIYELFEPISLPVILNSTPVGPSFPAATWITFDCSTSGDSGSGVYTYVWNVYCSSSMELVYQSSAGSATSLQIKSTPTECFDVIECVISDTILPASNRSSVTISDVTGVGIFANDNPVANNTALLASNGSEFGTIYCTSGSRDPNIGLWYHHSGALITSDNGGKFDIEYGGVDIPSYAALRLKPGQVLDSDDEGVYTCVIPDHMAEQQILYVGIYRTDFFVTPSVTVTGLTGAGLSEANFSVTCTSAGAPAITTFYQDIPGIPSIGISTYNDSTHYIVRSLSDATLATYDNTLVFDSYPSTPTELGEHACVAETTYLNALGNGQDTLTATGTDYFGLYEVGSSADIFCTDISADNVSWLNSQGATISSSTSGSALLPISLFSDNDHEEVYTCRRTAATIVEDLQLTVLILIPSGPIIALTITTTSPSRLMTGNSLSVACTGVHTVAGISLSPELSWISPNGMTLLSENNDSTVTLVIESVHTSQAGLYRCTGVQYSAAYVGERESTSEFSLEVEIPSPLVEVTIQTGPLYATESTDITCRITLVAEVDDVPSVLVDWQGPQGNLSSYPGASISVTTEVSSGVYVSEVTLPAVTVGETGSYNCSVVVESSSQFVVGTSASAAAVLTVSEPFPVISLELSLPSVLDISPSNVHNITCTASLPINVNVVFEWRRFIAGSGSLLTSNGDNVTITAEALDSFTSASVLEVVESTAGSVVYNCTVNIPAAGIQSSDIVTVIVKGPSLPILPVDLSTPTTSFQSATIQWTVPYIAYDAEVYTVQYRSNSSIPILLSQIVGTGDLTQTNISYSVQLSGLTHDTTYFYQVMSMNSIGSTSSQEASFLSIPLPLSVAVTSTGISLVGATFNLTCTVSEDESINGTASVTWQGPNGTVTQSYHENITLLGPTSTGEDITLVLVIDPVTFSVEGTYTCTAVIGVDPPQIRSSTIEVAVGTVELNVLAFSSPSGPVHQAASQVNLTCQPIDFYVPPVRSVEWTSTCSGSCFVPGMSGSVITREALRASDAGVHTCTLIDALGNRGTGEVVVNVSGIGFSYEGISVPDNSELRSSPINPDQLSILICASSSLSPSVGQWIAPNGMDITQSTTALFEVTVGGIDNPGFLSMQQRSGAAINFSNGTAGVYTCALSDENGIQSRIRVGVYPFDYSNPPISITSFAISANATSVLSLSCNSNNSIPTSVTWSKNNVPLELGTSYQTEQVLLNGVQATYDNVLLISTPLSEVAGNYTCNVVNFFSVSVNADSTDLAVYGIQVSDIAPVLTVGETAVLQCQSDLHITSIQWIYKNTVIASSTNKVLTLTFDPVSDNLHGQLYTCQVVTPYGQLEQEVILTVLFPPELLLLSVSVEADSVAIAGEPLSVNCSVTIPQGVTSPVTLQWEDVNGIISTANELIIGDPIVLGSTTVLSIRFDPLRAVHGNRFFCKAVIVSPAPPNNISRLAELAIVVQVIGSLGVTVSSEPGPSPGLTFLAGSALQLTCTINSGGTPPFSYEWSSTCSGECFVLAKTSQTIVQSILHSSDSGNHTCVATDFIGRSGIASINVNVTGVAVVHISGSSTEILSNNSIVQASQVNGIREFQCISGSTVPFVGRWVSPGGNQITNSTNSLIDVSVGDPSDPGFVSIRLAPEATFTGDDEGVYTCEIPDERGNLQLIRVGIYRDGFSEAPVVNALLFTEGSSSLLSLNCTSTGSPAGRVVWLRNFITIDSNTESYDMYQVLIDGSTATYENVLTSDADPRDLQDNYACIVIDSADRRSQIVDVDVEGLVISGDTSIVVGEEAVLTCSSDFSGTTAEWLHNGSVLANSDTVASLEFLPVTDVLHGNEYICRINTSLYEPLVESITFQVDVPASVVNITIIANNTANAGYPFTATCTVTIPQGLSGPVELNWVGPDSTALIPSQDIDIQESSGPEYSNLVLLINPLRTYDEGTFSCIATVMSPALAVPITPSAEHYLDVQILFPLEVNIMDTTGAPQDSEYCPGSSVSLNCSVQRDFPPVNYQWVSTCGGDCFVLQQSRQSLIERSILHAVDAGNHTCFVVDDIGNTGNDTIDIKIVGASLYLADETDPRVLPNNAVIFTGPDGSLPLVQCISGSLQQGVGEWIPPSSQTDPFNVTFGGVSDPGYFNVMLSTTLSFADEGVYTCSIPDYTGENVLVHVGIYYPPPLNNRELEITMLEEYASQVPPFVIRCATLGSPPTVLQWRKDSRLLNDSSVFNIRQILRDASIASYDNFITVYGDPDSVIGTYECFVENEIDDARQTVVFDGLTITGTTNLIVSQIASLSCTTDFQVESLTWLLGSEVVSNTVGEQQLVLTFDPVSDSLHNRVYTCRSVTSYGVQERNVTITVQVPISALEVSIIPDAGMPTASQRYQMQCTASVLPGIDSPVTLQWLIGEGQELDEDSDISISAVNVNGTLTSQYVIFSVLRTNHSAEYSCNASLSSPALDEPLLSTAEFILTVETIELGVMISPTPSDTQYTASSPLTITCQPELGTGMYTYQWSSNCTGNCFVDNQTTPSLQRNALRSTDSGVHVCTVMDDAGNSGEGMFPILVTGAGFYIPNGIGQLPRNPIVFTTPDGYITQLWCISGSRMPQVGRWISPNTTDITDLPNSPFNISYGDDNNPGFAVIETLSMPLSAEYEGVYTCYIPDETEGLFQSVYVGIYLPGFSTPPVVTSLERDATTLTCNTTGSPPTVITWTKNGEPLPRNKNGYKMNEILIDGRMATFANILTIDLPPADLVGTYSCSVLNAIGSSNSEQLEVQGLQLSGNDAPFLVSSTVTLSCTSDLEPVIIEWLFSDIVVSNSSSSVAELTFDPVSDDLHGRVYICRVTSPFGVQLGNTTISVLVPDSALTISVIVEGELVAGESIILNCIASKSNEVGANPRLIWIRPNGEAIQNDTHNLLLGELEANGTRSSLPLTFPALRTSTAGEYMCLAALSSPALSKPLMETSVSNVTIQISPPDVNISRSSTTIFSGSILTLTCIVRVIPEVDTSFSVTTNWLYMGIPLVNDIRTTVNAVEQLSRLIFRTEVVRDPVSRSQDNGLYTCEINVTPGDSSGLVLGVRTSVSDQILEQEILAPTLNIEVRPQSLTLLDIAPYNMATLSCFASQPPSVVIDKQLIWARTPVGGTAEALIGNGVSINISVADLESPVSSSTLSLVLGSDSIGVTNYFCMSSLNIPGDLLVMESAAVIFSVKGSSLPTSPNLSVAHISHNSASVQWLVPAIAYTPETYNVHYGVTSTNLNGTSPIVLGLDDVTSTNRQFSIVLEGLEAETTYYYQIEARNSIGSAFSSVADFITPPMALTVSSFTSGSNLAGDFLNLTCTMRLTAGLSGAPGIEWRRSDGSIVDESNSIMFEGPTVEGSFSVTLVLQFSPLLASHAGQYSCHARIDSPNRFEIAIATENVYVQLPSPRVNLIQSQRPPHYEGTSLSLTCNVELSESVDILIDLTTSWKLRDYTIEDTGRISLVDGTTIGNNRWTYITSITFIPLSTSDGGEYSCEISVQPYPMTDFVSPVVGRGISDNIVVEGLPPPTIFLSSPSTALVGTPYSVVCTVSTVANLVESTAIDVRWLTSSGAPITHYDSSVDLPRTVDNVTTIELQFEPLHTTHGGAYLCQAYISITILTLTMLETSALNLVAQIPEPQILITAPFQTPLLSGMTYTLICDASLTTDIDTSVNINIIWERNGTVINDTQRTSLSDNIPLSDFVYRSILSFATLSRAVDSGRYSCVVFVIAAELVEYIGNVSAATSHAISVEDPSIAVSVMPPSFTGFDRPPYNSFSFVCNTSKPNAVLPELEVDWLFNGSALNRSSSQITITNLNANEGTLISSVLSVIEANVSNSGTYACLARITILNLNSITSLDSASVVIRGPSLPVVPIDIIVTVVNGTTAIISWTLPFIIYTQEQYYITYGLDAITFNTDSFIIEGNSNFTAVMETFSIAIDNLQPSSEYFFAVVTINQAGVTRTPIRTFYTSLATPTTGPDSFNVSRITSQSALLTWDLPPANYQFENGLIVAYGLTCQESEGPLVLTSMLTDTEFELTALIPAARYNCSVTAFNNVGEGSKSQLTFTTQEDVPEDSPSNVMVLPFSTSSVLVAWDPPSISNGIITQYILYVDIFDGLSTVVPGNVTQFEVTGLMPYQLVVIEVAAATSVGEGPRGAEADGRSEEEAILAPSVSVTSSSANTITAGQELTLMCLVIVQEVSLPPVEVTWLDSEGMPLTPEMDITFLREDSIDSSSSLTEYSVHFGSVRTSHAGVLTCQATLYSTNRTIAESNNATHSITIQMPTPGVAVTSLPTSMDAGINLTLICTIDLSQLSVDTGVDIITSWSMSGVNIVTSIISSVVVNETRLSGLVYMTTLPLGVLMLGSSDGEYTCEASIEPLPDSDYILFSARRSDLILVRATVPSLMVNITPFTAVTLDIAPYNVLDLTCNATASSNITIPKALRWSRNSVEITNNNVDVVISTEGLDNRVTISILTVSSSVPGSAEYRCSVNLDVPGGSAIEEVAAATNTIYGPSLPLAVGIRVVNATATSATIEWTVPLLVYTPETYTLLYGRSSLDQVISVPSVDELGAAEETYGITISQLMPATNYSLEIVSENTVGSTSVQSSFSSLETAPTGPPLSFTITAITSTMVEFSWSPPEETLRNGRITSYRLACDPVPDDFPALINTAGVAALKYNSGGFMPATLYSCSVYASTDTGEGPPTSTTTLTPEDLPGTVTELTTVVLSVDTIQISWREPNMSNGQLLSYSVVIRTIREEVLNTSLNSSRLRVILVADLERYIPYIVSVRASTALGFGKPQEKIVFTEEGTPVSAPSDIRINRLNGSHMAISWDLVSLEEARGFVINHVIDYDAQTDNSRRKRASLRVNVSDGASAVIGGLDVAVEYSVTVSAETVAGVGVTSEPVIATTPPSSLLQLRLSGIQNCTKWIREDNALKTTAILDVIINVLINIEDCQCSLTEYYIRDTQFSCSKELNDTVFRARVFNTPETDSVQIRLLFQRWVETGPTVIIIGQKFAIEPTCTVAIQSFEDDFCPPRVVEEPEGFNFLLVYIVVGVVGGVIILVLLLIIMLCCCRATLKRRKTYIVKKTSDSRYPTIPVTSFELIPTDQTDTGEIDTSLAYYNPENSPQPESGYNEREVVWKEAGEPISFNELSQSQEETTTRYVQLSHVPKAKSTPYSQLSQSSEAGTSHYGQFSHSLGAGAFPIGSNPMFNLEASTNEPLQMTSFGLSLSQQDSTHVASQDGNLI